MWSDKTWDVFEFEDYKGYSLRQTVNMKFITNKKLSKYETNIYINMKKKELIKKES